MALEIVELSKVKVPWTIKRSIVVLITSLVLGVSLFTFAFIFKDKTDGFGAVNQSILAWATSHRNSELTNVLEIITNALDPMNMIIGALIIATLWVIIKKEIWRPTLLIGSIGLVTITSTVLKSLIHNTRPDQINMVKPFETGFSFPSGHTIEITVFMLIISYLICSRNLSIIKNISWLFATLAGVSVIAISRLYLGYHWLTDVIASIGLGLIILSIIIFCDLIFDYYQAKKL